MPSTVSFWQFHPAALCLAAGVLLAVCGWRLALVARARLGPRQAADRFSAIRQFEQNLGPNHANTRLVFCRMTAGGLGLYFCRTVGGGPPRLLCEQPENGLQWRRFCLLGWSPDDRWGEFWPPTQPKPPCTPPLQGVHQAGASPFPKPLKPL